MKLVGKLILTLLSVAGLLGIFWLSLPWLLVSFTTQQLEVRGFSNIEFGDVKIGLHSAELESLQLSSDSMDFAAGQVAVSYHLPRLMSANLSSISVDTMDIVSNESTSSSSSSPDVAWLAGLLATPWYNYLPADQINVHQFTFSDEASGKSTHASIQLTRAENELHATVNLDSGENRSHKLVATLSSEGKLDVRLQGKGPDAATPLLLITEPGSQAGNIFIRFTADLNELALIFPLLANDLQGQLEGELSLVDEVNVQQRVTLVTLKAQLHDGAVSNYSASHLKVAATGSLDSTDGLSSLRFDKASQGNAKQVSLNGLTIEEAAFSFPDEIQVTDSEITITGSEDTGIKLNHLRQGDINIPTASLKNLHFTIIRASDTDAPLINGSLILELSELRKDEVVITASPINIKLQSSDSTDSAIKLDANTDTLVVDTTEAMVEFSQCSMTVWLPENRVSADMLCHLVYPEAPVNAHLEYQLNEEAGIVTFNTGKAMPTDEQPLFSTALKNWDQPFDLVSGSIVANGKYSWKADKESLNVNLWIEDAGGFYESVLFSGMEYEAQLQLLPELHTLKPSTLKVDIVDVGIPVTDTRASIKLKPSRHGSLPLVITNNLHMNLLEGEVTGNDIKYDLNLDNNNFILDITGLNLSAVVDLQQVEGLQASGLMDGQIPVHIGKDGLTVLNGKLHVRPPGGRIQYAPEGGTHEMEQAAPGTNIVFEILEDLNYHTLDTGVNYTPDGNLTLSLAIKGKSPKLDKKRPVHFNLNLEQNVLQLLKSLRIAEDIDSVLDKNVQDYFRNQ